MPNSKKGLVLLDRSGSSVRVASEMIDVMLSPTLYTLKQESLELKYQYQAKKLAPSVLDDLLEEGEYEYSAIKEDGGWLFIAYSPQEIMDALLRSGIEASQVGAIYFAQQSKSMFNNPIALDGAMALGLVDDVVTVMPKALFGERRFLSFDESFRPSGGGVSLSIDKGAMIAKKDAIVLSSIFILLGMLFLFEGIGYSSAVSEQSSSVEVLLEDYPALQSKYSRDSIAAKYQKRDKNERKKRDFLKEVSSIVRYGGVVQELEITSKVMRAKLEVKNPSSYNSVDKSIKIKKLDHNMIELEAKV